MVSKLDNHQILPVVLDDATSSLRVKSVAGSLITDSYDYISAAYPNATTEEYTYKTGGSGGTTVGIITVVYTSAAKETISTVART